MATKKTVYAPNAPKARATALSWVGRTFSPGWCLYWCLVYVYKVPGLGDYDYDGDADATDYWKAAKQRGTVVEVPKEPGELTEFIKNIPAGVLISWTGGGKGYGHAAYSLGGGRMVSTDLPTRGKVGEVDIAEAHRRWSLTLVGYVVKDANGFTLVQPDKPAPPKPKPEVYKVTAKTGLHARSAPSSRAKSLGVAKLGAKITASKIVTGDSRQWVVTSHKPARHYAMEYLSRV